MRIRRTRPTAPVGHRTPRGASDLARGLALSVAAAGLVLVSPTSASAEEVDDSGPAGIGVSYAETADGVHDSWMSWVPDDRPLTHMSIPMAHDAMSYLCPPGASYCPTQTMTLPEQLKAGIRGLDIRIRYRNGSTAGFQTGEPGFTVAHGPYDLEDPATGKDMSVGVVFDNVCTFLRNHPTETVLLRLGDIGQDDRHDVAPGETSRPSGKNVTSAEMAATWAAQDAAFQKLWDQHSDCMDPGTGDLPTLGVARGSLVINWAASWELATMRSTFGHDQGTHNSGGNEATSLTAASLQSESEMLAWHLHETSRHTGGSQPADGPDDDGLHQAQINAWGGATPRALANGAFGLTGMNQRMTEFLLGYRRLGGIWGPDLPRLGVVMMDFPSEAFIGSVLIANLRWSLNTAALDLDAPGVQADVNEDMQRLFKPFLQAMGADEHGYSETYPYVRDFWQQAFRGERVGVVAQNPHSEHLVLESTGPMWLGSVYGNDQYDIWRLTGQTPPTVTAAELASTVTAADISGLSGASYTVRNIAETIKSHVLESYPGHRVTVVTTYVGRTGTGALMDVPGGVAASRRIGNYLYSFVLQAGPDAPSADAGGPYTVEEGTAPWLSAGGSTGAGTLTYAWDLDGDGQHDDGAGRSVRYDARAVDAPAAGIAKTVSVEVTDAYGRTGVDEAALTIVNVAPRVNVSVTTETTVPEGSSVAFTLYARDSGDSHLDYRVKCPGIGSFRSLAVGNGMMPLACVIPDDGPSIASEILWRVLDGDGGRAEGSIATQGVDVSPRPGISVQSPVDEGGSTEVTVTNNDPARASDGPYRHELDCDGDGLFEKTQQSTDPFVASTTYLCPVGDDNSTGHDLDGGTGYGDYVFAARIVDADGVATPVAETMGTVRNVAPTASAALVDPSPKAGSITVISVTAQDAGDPASELRYSFDCDGDSVFEVGPQTGSNGSCVFTSSGLKSIGWKVVDDGLEPGHPDLRSAAHAAQGVVSGVVEAAVVEAVDPARLTAAATATRAREGGTTTVSVSATAPEGGSLTYAFDCDGDGSMEIGPQAAASTACPVDDEADVPAIGWLVSAGDLSDEGVVTPVVDGVAPAAARTRVLAPRVPWPGETFSQRLIDASDPSPADMAAGLTYGIRCGAAGDVDTTDAPVVRCRDMAPGDWRITSWVEDKDGLTSTYATRVRVLTLPQSATSIGRRITVLDRQGRVTKAQASSLRASLGKVATALDRGKLGRALRSLQGLRKETDGLRPLARRQVRLLAARLDASIRAEQRR